MKNIQFAFVILIALLLSACGGGGSAPNNSSSNSATLVSISITPAASSIPVGLTQQHAAQANYSDGSSRVITGVTYASSNTAFANTVAGNEGTVVAISPGIATVTATYSGKIATAQLEVTPAALLSITISPTTASIPVGTTQQFSVTGNYSDGTTQPITSASWSSTSSTAANIDSTGLASSLAAGNSNIVVAFGGKTTSASLLVTPATLLSITVTPAAANIVSGTTQQYSATGSYSDGTTKVIANPTWSSSLPSVAAINTSGIATAGAGSGSTNITATSGGQSATVPLTVTLATPVSLTLVASNGAATTLPLNSSPFMLTPRINYSNGTSQSTSANAVWTSSNTAVGTIWGVWGGVMPVSVGTTTITVAEAGFSASIAITYTAPAPVSSTILGLDTVTNSYSKRTTAQLSARINYSSGSPIPATLATWSSSDVNVFTVDANGLFKGVGAGTATLTLIADGFTSTRRITIVNPVATPTMVVTCNPAAPMIISSATWNAGYAVDPQNTTEWVTVDPVTCANYAYTVLVVKATVTSQYVTLQAPRYSASVYGPAITRASTLTPQLSSGNNVTVGNTATSSSFTYTPIYSIVAAP